MFGFADALQGSGHSLINARPEAEHRRFQPPPFLQYLLGTTVVNIHRTNVPQRLVIALVVIPNLKLPGRPLQVSGEGYTCAS